MAQQPIPLELTLLEQALDREFTGLIIGVGKKVVDCRRNFLSKAVGAFVLMQEAGATAKAAAQAVVDGGGDHGLDAIYVGSNDTLWLVQTKYIASGSGEPDLGDVSKFKDGIQDLLAQKYDRFNNSINKIRGAVEVAMRRGGCKVHVVLAYTGTALSDDKRTILADIERLYNAINPGSTRCFVRGISSLHGLQLDAQAANPIEDAEVELKNFGYISDPYRGYYGRLSAKRLSELVRQYDDRIVEKNIRRFRGSTVVNEGMLSTIHNESAHFFYFNNGVTFLCDSIRALPPVHETREIGRFNVSGLSVINGAQTVGSIAREPAEYYDAHPAEVLATFICLENAPEPETFGMQVTQFRNRQNAVDLEDFAGLDEQQDSWKATLELAGVTYLFKHGDDDPPLSDSVFSVREAAPALACSRTTADWADYVIAAKSDRKRLFRRPEHVRAGSPLNNAYKELFRDSLTAREMWCSVQIQRLTEKTLRDRAKGEQDQQDADILRQGVWIVLHILFIKTKLQNEATLVLTEAEKLRISVAIDVITNQLVISTKAQNYNKQFRSVFENKTDCQAIKSSMMAALIQPL